VGGSVALLPSLLLSPAKRECCEMEMRASACEEFCRRPQADIEEVISMDTC
jgi:hypothetical protein